MRRLIAYLLTLALVWPGAAWANIDCSSKPGAQTLGPITTLSNGCVEGGGPANTHHIHSPVGSDLTVTEGLTWASGTESGLSCYGALTIDAKAQGGAIRLQMGQGQTDEPGTEVINFYAAPTCELNIRAGYGTWGVETPSLEYGISRADNTIWEIPYIIMCGTGEDTIGQIPDSSGFCTGAQARNFCWQWPLSIVDPEDGSGTSEGWVQESVAAIDTDVTVVVLTGKAAGTAWPIRSLDTNPDNDSMGACIDAAQRGFFWLSDSGDNPSAEREIKLAYVEAAVGEGATCVSVASSAGGTGGVLAASGDMAGWCYRPEGSCECYRTIKTVDGTDCTGGSDDALYFAPEDPLPAIASGAKSTLDLVGIECGDQVAMMHGVNITIDENRTEGDGKVRIDSLLGAVDGLTVTGTAIDFVSPGFPMSNVYVFSGGDGAGDTASMTLSGSGSFAMFSGGIVGSGTGSGSGGFHDNGFDGPILLDNFSIRHKGDIMIESIGAATSHPRTFNRLRCEFIDHGSGTNLGCIHTHGDWAPSSVTRWMAIDSTNGIDGSLFAATTIADVLNVRDGIALGITSGGLAQGNEVGTGEGIYFANLIGRGATGTRSGGDGTVLGRVMHGFNFYDWYSTSGVGGMFPNAVQMSNGRIELSGTPGTAWWRIVEDADLASLTYGHNIEIVTPILSDADPAIIMIDTDGVAATCIDLKGITVRSHTGADGTTGARYGIYSADDGTGETCFDIDNVLVSEIDVTGAPGDFTAIDIAPNLIALIPEGSGNLCATLNTAAGTYLAADDIADYDIEPELSWRLPVRRGTIVEGAQSNTHVCTGATGKRSSGNTPVDSWVEMVSGMRFDSNVFGTEGR